MCGILGLYPPYCLREGFYAPIIINNLKFLNMKNLSKITLENGSECIFISRMSTFAAANKGTKLSVRIYPSGGRMIILDFPDGKQQEINISTKVTTEDIKVENFDTLCLLAIDNKLMISNCKADASTTTEILSF
ncbi:MAG: hypothetical protein LBM05_00560 [Endomicrobium sp.]|nr:hypothetical protein [Endomicrobium sp.]